MELGLVEEYNQTKFSKLFPHEAPREARPLRDWLLRTVRILVPVGRKAICTF